MTNLFFDKRDKDYYRIQIRDHLFDVFKHKTRKAKFPIPTTVSIANGKINSWYFNSKKEPGHPILMRNSDKLSNFEILKYFADLKGADEKPTLDQTIKKFQLNAHFHDSCAFVRFNNGEKAMVTGSELAMLLTDRLTSIKSVQSIVETQLKQNTIANVLLCEYRNDKDEDPPTFAFNVKVTLPNSLELYKANQELFSSKNPKRINIEYIYRSHMDNIESSSQMSFLSEVYGDESNIEGKYKTEVAKGYINVTNKVSYYKSLDTRANTESSKLVKEIASYIENTYKFRVKKLVCAFITDSVQRLHLVGIKELLFDFLDTGVYNVDSISGAFRKGNDVDFNELVATIQMAESGRKTRDNPMLLQHTLRISEIKQELIGMQYVKDLMREEGGNSRNTGVFGRSKSNQKTKPQKKAFSNLLMSKITSEQCQGDFCEFYTITNSAIFLDDFRDVKIEDELQKQKDEVTTYKDILRKPYEISNSLRVRCRDNLKETLTLMKEHQIVPRINNTFINADQDNESQLVAFIKMKTMRKDVENLENLYKSIRVCRLCFTVYRLMNQYFEKIDGPPEKLRTTGSLPRLSQASRRSTLPDMQQPNTARESPTHGSQTGRSGNQTGRNSPRKDREWSDVDLERRASQDSNTLKRTSSMKKISMIRNAEQNAGAISTTRDIVKDEGMNSRGMQSARDLRATSAMRVTVTRTKITDRRSSSTLTNTRMSHGIMQKVSQPAIRETEKKVMMERELMKRERNREGKYVHNLLEHVENKKPQNQKSLGMDKHERGAKKASLSFIEAAKELEAELAMISKQNRSGGDSPIRSTPEKKAVPTFGDLRKRVTQKLYELTEGQKNKVSTHKDLDIVYHKSMQRVNNLADYRLTTPWPQTFYGKLYSYETKAMSFSKYCDIRHIHMPNGPQISNIEQLVLDPKTAIPFLVLTSPESDHVEASGYNVLVVVHDMFHSFFEDISMYEDMLKGLIDTKIVMFNYPGQGFTSYDPAHLQTNEEIGRILDILLNYLYEKEKISFDDRLFLVGIGYGGNIVAYFLCCNLDMNTNIEAVLIVNSFIKVDEEIEKMGREWIETLRGLPNDIPEIHFNHYYVMALNQESALMMRNAKIMQAKIEINPIKIEGKIFLLRGLIESLDISDLFKRVDVNVYVVHSLNNCIFRSNNAEMFIQRKPKEGKKPKNDKKTVRKLVYYEGGHDIATENPDSLKKIINDFVASSGNKPIVNRKITVTKTTEEA